MENKQTQSGVGFFGLLTLVFIALKLMGYIDWQWKWVLAPIWIPAIVCFVIVVIIIIAKCI